MPRSVGLMSYLLVFVEMWVLQGCNFVTFLRIGELWTLTEPEGLGARGLDPGSQIDSLGLVAGILESFKQS